VVPLRISQGIQNKVLEALASGLPVVTTPQVAGGIHGVDQLPVAVANSQHAIADKVVNYLLRPSQTDAQISSSRSFLARYYSWDTNLSALEKLLKFSGPLLRKATP
jgi:glycosyltransferase involved in cell wall biosynthesis